MCFYLFFFVTLSHKYFGPIEDIMFVRSFFFDRLLLLAVLIVATLILWWLTSDIFVALICLATLIIISFIARLYQPWNEEKILENLNIKNQKKPKKPFLQDK